MPKQNTTKPDKKPAQAKKKHAPTAQRAHHKAFKKAPEKVALPYAAQKEFTVSSFHSVELRETLYTLGQLRAATKEGVHIALVGRSNVGKSSLLNALAGRKSLARVSATPGKTRSVNLFYIAPQGYFLTDLPGYGYAKRSKTEKEEWAKLIEEYLAGPNEDAGKDSGREMAAEENPVRAVVLLLDARLPPQELDKSMAAFAFAHQLPLVPVLTKADKTTQAERAALQKQWAGFLNMGTQEIIPVSARTGMGLQALWDKLDALALNTLADATLAGATLAEEDSAEED